MKLLDLKNNIYDSTFLKSMQLCERKTYYRWIQGIEPDSPKTALVFGAAMHEALAVWHDPKPCELEQRKAIAIKAMLDEMKDIEPDELRTKEKALSVFTAYVAKYPTEQFEVLKVEIPFSLEMSTGMFAGRIDATVRWMKRIYVLDHKTTRALGKTFFSSFRPDVQFDGYTYAVRELYGDCAGALINALQVAKTKDNQERYISDRVERDFERFIDTFERKTKRTQYLLNKPMSEWEMNTTSCSHWGECEYRDICLYGERAIDKRFRQVETTREDK